MRKPYKNGCQTMQESILSASLTLGNEPWTLSRSLILILIATVFLVGCSKAASPVVSSGDSSVQQESSVSGALLEKGRALVIAGDKEAGLKLLKESLERGEAEWGPDSPKLLPVLHEIYKVDYRESRFDEALVLAERCLKIQKKAYGPESKELIDTLNRVIAASCAGKKCEDTGPLLREQLDLRVKHLGPDHPHVAVSWALLGELAEKKGDYDKALSCFENALAIRRKSDPTLVENSERNIVRVHQKILEKAQLSR